MSGFPNGFDYSWRARSAYWFIFLSTWEFSLNQCLMDEEYKCSSSLDLWWVQLWSCHCNSLTALLQDWANVALWESLLDIACLPFQDLFPFPNHISLGAPLIYHIDTKSHLRICFGESKLKHYPNFYLFILHRCTAFIFFLACVKAVIIDRVAYSFIIFISHGLWTNWGQGLYLSLSLAYPQHLASAWPIVVA